MSAWDPPVDYPFQASRANAGPHERALSLSGLTIDLRGLADDQDAFVAGRFRRYLRGESAGRPDLTLNFYLEDLAPYYSVAEVSTGPSPYRMSHAIRDGVLYHASPAVCARLDLRVADGRVLVPSWRASVSRLDPVHMAMENLLRSCLAWTVLMKGGLMVHAASVVKAGRCYLFFGNSGSGKSTIASICGGEVISDDLTMILPGPGGFEAIGSPFRGTYSACEDLTNRYPVVALYRLIKDEKVYLERRPRAVAFTDLLANLPFVVSEIDRHPEAWGVVENAFRNLRLYYLHFRKDASFWAVIEAEENERSST
ncbi:MAG TPA: hypothetical protein VI337_05880 [Nitrospirales bacterium]|nr:hypothetical protein [Nitrospirales bacterium]